MPVRLQYRPIPPNRVAYSRRSRVMLKPSCEPPTVAPLAVSSSINHFLRSTQGKGPYMPAIPQLYCSTRKTVLREVAAPPPTSNSMNTRTLFKGEGVAILIPCFNEAQTIEKVVCDFRTELPNARIVVIDNASTDDTVKAALLSGAEIRHEPRRGKGYVVEQMLREIDADYFVMVDGDDTYPASFVHQLLAPVMAGYADMCVGARLSSFDDAAFRPMHLIGNQLIRILVNWIGQSNLSDILSGYRAYSRRVARELPVTSPGFEVETDMAFQMLYYQIHITEIAVPYRARPTGSKSKLRTFRDGARVLWKIFTLLRSVKPLTFFGGISVLLLLLGFAAAAPLLVGASGASDDYLQHIPEAIMATGLVLLSFGFLFVGIVLHAVNWRLRELHNVLTRPARR